MPIKAIDDPRPTHQPRRIDLPVQKEKKKKKTESEQEKVTVAIENIATRRPRTSSSEKLSQFETSKNSHLKAEGNLEQIRRTRTPMKGIIGLTGKLPLEKGKNQILISEFGGGARFRDKFPSLNVIQTGSKNGKISTCTSVRPKMHRLKMRSKKNLHGMAHTSFIKSSSRRMNTARMSTKKKLLQK